MGEIACHYFPIFDKDDIDPVIGCLKYNAQAQYVFHRESNTLHKGRQYELRKVLANKVINLIDQKLEELNSNLSKSKEM